jgi:hypothetical protein
MALCPREIWNSYSGTCLPPAAKKLLDQIYFVAYHIYSNYILRLY